MAAAPQYALGTFVGLKSRQTYTKDIYASDVVAASLAWDDGAGASATSKDEWRAPEPLVMVDFAIHTGMTDTTMVQVTRNGVMTGDILRYAAHLDTSTGRPKLAIRFNAGDVISGIQRA